MIGYIFIIIGLILYYLSYQSPRTDVILYGFAGIFILLGSVAGLVNNDLSLPIGYESVMIDNTTHTEISETPILSTSIYYSWAIPLVFLFLSLYLLINTIYLRN